MRVTMLRELKIGIDRARVERDAASYAPMRLTN
jgi:hypothetical protein